METGGRSPLGHPSNPSDLLQAIYLPGWRLRFSAALWRHPVRNDHLLLRPSSFERAAHLASRRCVLAVSRGAQAGGEASKPKRIEI